MANDRLRTAMLAANLTVEQLAEKVGRDPKTAERWISVERIPHRATRLKLTALLGVNEADLWPTLAGDARPAPEESELLHLYESRSAITGTVWEALIAGVQESMDVLVFSGAFLVEQYNLVRVIRQKAAQGVRFRLLVGDEKSPAVIQRAVTRASPAALRAVSSSCADTCPKCQAWTASRFGHTARSSTTRSIDSMTNCWSTGMRMVHSPVRAL